ncbi:MAG: hypothetical protein GQ564_18225 [Bacteroidales bacterium]|nr:hypothetical protein [Bacteroidales bacterium]
MKNFITAIILIVLFTKCEYLIPDKWYDLIYLSNESDIPISYFVADSFVGNGSIYPDTILPEELPYLTYPLVKSNEKQVIVNQDHKIENYFKFPADTLSVFIFHTDTLNKYSWEEVRDGYMILKRYDLSLDDLEVNNYTIIYP